MREIDDGWMYEEVRMLILIYTIARLTTFVVVLVMDDKAEIGALTRRHYAITPL